MGYTITLRYMTIELTADQQFSVCRHLDHVGFVTDASKMSGGCRTNSGKMASWYAFADMDDLKWGVEHNDMFTVFNAFRFDPSYTSPTTKTITDLSYHGDSGDAIWLFHNIAEALPELDGYIEWAGEEGDRFRWIFKDGVVTEISPRLVWENDA